MTCSMFVRALLGVALLCMLSACSTVVVDSDLNHAQSVYANQPPDTAPEVQRQLAVVNVRYYGFDGKLHRGQVVIHERLAEDIRQIFAVLRQTRFPVESVIPIAHPVIQLKGPYGLSSDTNNTSAYVWRPIVGARTVSMHALGLAIDINPRLNPYIKGDLVLPADASYDPARPGTLTPESEVVRTFKALGWEWGGDWAPKGKLDYMHFQKVPAKAAPLVSRYRDDGKEK